MDLKLTAVLIYQRLGDVIGVSRPLTGKSFRFVRACDAKLCVSARRMRFRLLGLLTDLQRRGRVRRSRSFAAFCIKNRPTPLRNRHFWLKTVKNVRASCVFIFRTVKNVRASRVFIFEIVVLLCFPDISVAKTSNCRTFWS